MRVLVIGAGLYGRYCADLMKRRGHHVTIVAEDDSLKIDQSRTNTASLINQARIHNGYHYPRSLSTAIESSKNYHRFIEDFSEAVIEFDQKYAIPTRGSLTSSRQFEEFCSRLGVKCEESYSKIITSNVDKLYDTEESAIDTLKMMQISNDRFDFDRLEKYKVIGLEKNVDRSARIVSRSKLKTNDQIVHNWNVKVVDDSDRVVYLQGSYDLIINCTYSGLNKIEKLAEVELTPIRHEVCEVAIFTDPENVLNSVGVTFMDGPFISFMPWSQDGKYSLTSVCHTPHASSKTFNDYLDVRLTDSRKDLMIAQMKKYIKSEIVDMLKFEESKYVIKTISDSSEVDDNRLVDVRFDCDRKFVSVLSGKLDAIYEVERKFEEKGVFKCLES